uniref:Peptidase S1 domain-containing protein n=1 Tax=Ciona savignyi TaxID=51511 RepID=H2YF26_CIOSA
SRYVCDGTSDCPWGSDELNCGQAGLNSHLEVKRGSGSYGLVCDVGWTINEAHVACRQLGFRWKFIPTTTARTTERTTTTTITTRPTTTQTTTVSPISRCGVKPSVDHHARPRIVGGNYADANEWPWQVGIWLPWQLKCGGTLIHSCWVLTAAHCFSQPYPTTSYWIRLGDHQTSKIDGTEQDFKIQRLIRHTFNVDSNDNDIALIELKRINGRCAIINEVVKPACLPTSPNQFPAGQKCQIVGWGQTAFQSSTPYTRLLKEATVALISRTDCATRSVYGSSLTNNMFCAGYMRGGVDTCQGDSGGPLLCQATNGRYYVWGIVSWGNGCAKPRAPGVYTVVANYVEWISRNTGLE